MVIELSPEKLRITCETGFMECATTEGLVPLREIIGQERAVRALKFGLGIRDHGFNIYVAGWPGTGRTTATKSFVEEIARSEPVPPDWCYVNNFSNQYEPKAIQLPAGKGKEFQKDIKNLIENIRSALPKSFESEDYSRKREATLRDLENQRKALIENLNAKAQQEGFVIQSSPVGLLLIPVVKGKPITEEELMTLPQNTKDEIQQRRDRLEEQLANTMRQFLDMERRIHEVIKKLNRDVALYAIGHLVDDVIDNYKDSVEVVNFLHDVQNDILENLQVFIRGEEPQQTPFPLPWMREAPFRKYEVNVIIDNSSLKGAPVVMEANPTYQNLIGRTEKEAQFGALTTDFTMIRAGALHKANQGYLIVRIEELLRNPFSYDALKRALRERQIRIEEPEERYGFLSIKSLKPQPIPLKEKIIIIGDPYVYQLLFTMDTDFNELFKVKAEFDTTMPRNDKNIAEYGAFVCALCQKENLKHLDSSALAKLVEHSSRQAEDQKKLSTKFAEVADVIREANYYAEQEESKNITADHVKKAVEEKIYRSKLIQEKIQEMINRGILLIETEENVTGQVNGLAVMGLGDFAFGSPSRVTASYGLGKEGVVDIEREAKMGGPIHTKGVLILSGYLTEKYAQDKPMSLSARIVFEQNYEGVEGDSAASTELYSLLSALSGFPIKQNIAVTGSVNQKGEVQAIGGVNQKVEGFYEVCKARGLTGKQGVMIPESNVQHLMLKEEVVNAVREGKFHMYAVRTIDEGIEFLTGVKAGERREDGTFEEGTVNYRVNECLTTMADRFKEYVTFEAIAKPKEND
ncbi:MAG TPA: ATP-binding protein [Candidatus Sulfotelmatobacter sp.]|nr:ATP-binding protein [Candidatus Sulfotelmatobacter sp.]